MTKKLKRLFKITIISLGVILAFGSCKKKNIAILLYNSSSHDSVKVDIYVDSIMIFRKMVLPNKTEYPLKIAEIKPGSEFVQVVALAPSLNLVTVETLKASDTKNVVITLQTVIDTPAVEVINNRIIIRQKDKIGIISNYE